MKLPLRCACWLVVVLSWPAQAQPPAPKNPPLPPGAVARIGWPPSSTPSPAVPRIDTTHLAHTSSPVSVALLPKRQGVVSLGADNMMRLWHPGTGKLLWAAETYPGIVEAAPNNAILATCGLKGVVDLWNAKTGQKLQPLAVAGWAYALSFSFDSKVLAAATDQGVVLGDVATGNRLGTLGKERSFLLSVAFAPGGMLLASGGLDGVVRLWHARKQRELLTLTGLDQAVVSVAFSHDGSKIAGLGGKGRFLVWDVVTGKRLAEGQGGRDFVMFAPDDASLIMQHGESAIARWHAVTGKLLNTWTLKDAHPRCISPSADGTLLVVGTYAGAVVLCDWTTAQQMTVVPEPQPGPKVERPVPRVAIPHMALTRGGKVLARFTFDSFEFWQLPEAKVLARFPCLDDSIAVAGAADMAVWRRDEDFIAAYDWAQRKEMTLIKNDDPQARLAISADGTRVVVVSGVGAVVYDSATGAVQRQIQVDWGKLLTTALSGDGKLLATADWDATIRVWNLAGGVKTEPRIISAAGPLNIKVVNLSHDGAMLSALYDDRSLRIWHIPTGTLALELRSLSSAALSADGRLVAGASADDMLRCWEIATGALVAEWPAADGSVTALTFSAEGAKLAAAYRQGTVLVWDLEGRPLVPVLTEPLTAKDGEKLWNDLANRNAQVGYAAVQTLATHPQQALELLSSRLEREPMLVSLVVEQLLDKLEDTDLNVRAATIEDLQALGHLIAPALRTRLAAAKGVVLPKRLGEVLQSLKWSSLGDEELRQVRAVAVLEQIGSPAAWKLLKSLAAGDPLTHQTQASRQVLARKQGG
jgi:WD40 repeat protein